MTTAKPPARYGAIEGARPGGFALPSYTTTGDTTRANTITWRVSRLTPRNTLLASGRRRTMIQDYQMSDTPIRHFNLTGASNFRDLGGYPGHDGRRIRWRQLFRSNHLGHLTEADVGALRGLGLRNAFDLRGTEERLAAACAMPEIAVHSLPIEPTVVAALRARLAKEKPLSPADGLEAMRESYRNYVQHNTPRFRSLFAHLLDDPAPLVVHCTAGKDRTGFACALILHTLGVSEDVIAADYLLTNRYYRRDPAAGSDIPDDVKQVLGAVDASFLAAAFEAIRIDYGDLSNYIADGLGLGPTECVRLQARYLEA